MFPYIRDNGVMEKIEEGRKKEAIEWIQEVLMLIRISERQYIVFLPFLV